MRPRLDWSIIMITLDIFLFPAWGIFHELKALFCIGLISSYEIFRKSQEVSAESFERKEVISLFYWFWQAEQC